MHDLLLFLAEQQPTWGHFQNWHYQRISGSANNLLYRATNHTADLAIKFTIPDTRRRAYREYQALLTLQEVALRLAPYPIFLDENNYPYPVVVQSWVEGEVTSQPPQTDEEWLHLIRHYATTAEVIPEKVTRSLATAVITFTSPTQAQQQIQKQLAHIPSSACPASLQTLLTRLDAWPILACPPAPTLALCRNDSNTLNFIRRPDQWLSVDWENSGWGDPAFEIVDIICHPQYASVPAERWQWVVRLYGEMVADETAVARIHVYTPYMLVWWVARLARAAYEVPRGLDERLVARPAHWQALNQTLYERYVALATAALDRIS